MFSSEAWLSNSSGFYNGVATQSLRFDRGGPKSLNRTPSSASNRKTWTWSGWIKPSIVGQSAPFFTAYGGTGSQNSAVSFNGNSFRMYNWNGSSNDYILETNSFYRDSSAWYHIAVAIDTTQGTASNRIKIYINREQITSFSTETYPSQNFDGFVNSSTVHKIGSFSQTTSFSYDGYMAEVNFVDGLALDPTYFGETKNGVWIAKKYSGSYGTNGFRLQFNQTGTGTASASTIGADTSGNTNHWTSSGIVASDCNMPDSPENNFATLNALDKKSAITLSDGNLKRTDSSDAWESITTSFGMSSGKYYAEFIVTVNGSGSFNNFMVGVVKSGFNGNISDSRFWASFDGHSYHAQDGNKVINGSGSGVSYGATWTVDDIIGVALNLDDGEITFYKNNASQGVANTGLSGEYVFVCATYHSGTQMFINCGQDSSFAGNETAQGNTDANGKGDFYYAPPSGFLALCTSNLPEPTISPNSSNGTADDYFNTVLYTGNGGTQAITGVGFQPDWVWIKERSSTSSHALFDSNRGVTNLLSSNSTSAETDSNSSLTVFGTDGFTSDGDGKTNQSSQTYVAWNWKANGGTTSSNTDGSITSTVQANTTAGFSIVTYTGNGTVGATIGHSLGANPAMIIVKGRTNVDNWAVYRGDLGGTERLLLNTTSSVNSDVEYWNNTNATSSVFTVRANSANNGSGQDYVAYCFAEVEGFSRFGSYTGNGNADGTFVYTGFRPAFFMVKRTDSSANWDMFDSEINPYNVSNDVIWANLSSAEASFGSEGIDFLSNGFKLRVDDLSENASGGTYIYMAFAETPTKYSLAR